MTDPVRARELEVVRAYHRATSHDFQRYARGPQGLDWDTQPDPFRRYTGARSIALTHAPVTSGPRYAEVLGPHGAVPVARVDLAGVSRLFEDSLALSAWKEFQGSRWALRINPSSGNLHPTEGYLLCGAVEGLCARPMLAHYAPREHALEVRADVPADAWSVLARGLPAGSFFVGLTSIHWREAWKYGERAWRYCELDAGHAIACISIAARALGWRAVLCDDLGNEDLSCLLGVRDAHGAEREEPHALIAVIPGARPIRASDLPSAVPDAFGTLELLGRPNELSPDHVAWDAIDLVAGATQKSRTSDVYASEVRATAAPSITIAPDDPLPLRPIVHGRRSAVSFDGRTEIDRDAFYRILGATLIEPVRALPWAPRVHLGLFVHRVRDLDPGLYVLVRDPAQRTFVQDAMQRPFAWERPTGCPEDLPLFLLLRGDARRVARDVSCHQDIASDGAFALAMLCESDRTLERYGAWFYPRLYWECGVVGQVLYLEAEALGVRATGIGCFFDEPTHAMFGIESRGLRSLYHFTIGGPVDDPRLSTLPAYS